MKTFVSNLLALTALSITVPLAAQTHTSEQIGNVAFASSCAPSEQAAINRGVALVHDFWYEEATRQFKAVAAADPTCSIAQWGIAMSVFHEIWNRPDETSSKIAWAALQKAKSPAAGSPREREYIDSLTPVFKPGDTPWQARIDAYSANMAALYKHYPNDVDAGAFYALSLLAAEHSDDTSLNGERAAMAVLTPLFATHPDNPGVLHYITHACDNPSLAPQALAAADRYAGVAPSGAHAVHMPGHIYARLGLWQKDIQVNSASVSDVDAMASQDMGDFGDMLHSQDFLLYAYIQSGQEGQAKRIIDSLSGTAKKMNTMSRGDMGSMRRMDSYALTEFPAIYDLETRDWKAAAALQPIADASPATQASTYWARVVAEGHLHNAAQAQADLAACDKLIDTIRKGKNAYMADGTGVQIVQGEMRAWVAFAANKNDEALGQMRETATLQDKVGQGEVDIPAREMLGDMLLELHKPQEALVEYKRALELSPNRFNGLFHAGMAAEEVGDKAKASGYYQALLKSTDDGAHSQRPELAHAKSFVSSTQQAAR